MTCATDLDNDVLGTGLNWFEWVHHLVLGLALTTLVGIGATAMAGDDTVGHVMAGVFPVLFLAWYEWRVLGLRNFVKGRIL